MKGGILFHSCGAGGAEIIFRGAGVNEFKKLISTTTEKFSLFSFIVQFLCCRNKIFPILCVWQYRAGAGDKIREKVEPELNNLTPQHWFLSINPIPSRSHPGPTWHRGRWGWRRWPQSYGRPAAPSASNPSTPQFGPCIQSGSSTTFFRARGPCWWIPY